MVVLFEELSDVLQGKIVVCLILGLISFALLLGQPWLEAKRFRVINWLDVFERSKLSIIVFHGRQLYVRYTVAISFPLELLQLLLEISSQSNRLSEEIKGDMVVFNHTRYTFNLLFRHNKHRISTNQVISLLVSLRFLYV